MEKTNSKMGRPVEPVPQDIADEVVEWIAEGKPLREFCRQEGKPSFSAIYAWQKKDPDFAERIACARESGEDVIAQECLEIADDGTNDWEERQNKDGSTYDVVNPEVVARSRLRVDTRLKLLAKWNPKKYGDKVDMNLGGQAGNPIQAAIAVTFVGTGSKTKDLESGG